MMCCTVVVFLLFYLCIVCVTSYDFSYVEINGHRFGYTTVDQEYLITKVGSHDYTDGDLIKFTCGFSSLDNNDSAWASITSNAYELVNISTKPKCLYKRESIDLYLKLSSEHDRKVISCHVNESSGQRRTSIIRITLTRVNKNRDIGFLVNGARATQIVSSINYKDLFFLYTHYNTETILIQSFTNKTLYGSISCDDAEISDVQSQPTISYTKVLADWDTQLNCQVAGVRIKKQKITLQLKKNAAALFSPIIRGLFMSRTLAMFHRDVNTLVILYEYDVDEVLDLECKSGMKFPEWELDDSKVAILSENKFRNTNEFLNNATFKLKTGEETASISCIVSSEDVKKAVDITLVVKNKKNFISTRAPPASMSTSSDTSAISATDKSSKKGDSKYLIIGASVGAALFIIVVILIIYKLLKRKRKSLNPNTDINYESLPEHKKGEMPVPSQWQDVQYVDPDDLVAESDYAEPHKPTLDEMYAKPLTKTQRNNHSTYASINNLRPSILTQAVHKKVNKNSTSVTSIGKHVTYADVELKKNSVSQTENPYEEVGVGESPYAEIISSENPYAEINTKQSEDYINVFDNERYVNSKTKDDYAEPAYSEISNCHK